MKDWTYTSERLPSDGRPVLVARKRNGRHASTGFDQHDGEEWTEAHPKDTVYAWRDVEAPEVKNQNNQ